MPDDPPTADPSWGLSNAPIDAPKKTNPTIRYCIRRIRNALGHARYTFDIPESNPAQKKFFDIVTITFEDENQNIAGDTFEVTLTLTECFLLVKKFQSTVHEHVSKKYGI